MFAAASRLVPLVVKSCRQIVPPVIATLIAAGLISAYNRAFTGHLQQPRLAALHQDGAEHPSEPVAKPLAPTEAVAIYDNIAPPARLWEKEAKQESGKDQTIKVAEPAPAPVRAAAPRPEKSEPRAEHRRVATGEPSLRDPHARSGGWRACHRCGPAARCRTAGACAGRLCDADRAGAAAAGAAAATGPAALSAAHPNTGSRSISSNGAVYQAPSYQPPSYQPPPYQPPVIAAQPVTVPDRPRPVEPAQTETPNPPQQGPIGKFVDTLKPANLLARARDFGEKIEQAGNDILPNIRPQ